MKRRPAKIITRVIVFLLLGAIVNVAVAWGCAWRVQFVYNEWPYRMGRNSLAFHTITFVEYRRFGSTRVLTNFWPSPDYPLPSTFPLGSPPYWTLEILAMTGEAGDGLPIDAFGIPLRTASCHWKNNWTLYDGIPLDDDQFMWVSMGSGRSALPTKVIWPGFAINTIFYAAIMGLLFFAPGSVRRTLRRRRGLCPACAYPVGTSPVCTECGKPVIPKSVEPT